MTQIDSEWQMFLKNNDGFDTSIIYENDVETQPKIDVAERNPCEDLYISTQTKIFFLNVSSLDVNKIFWNIRVIPYSKPQNRVIKKQMRLI